MPFRSSSCLPMLSLLSMLLLLLSSHFALSFAQTCNARFCLIPHEANETLTSLKDAQKSCKTKDKNSFPLEIYDEQLKDLLLSTLSNNTNFWKHHVLLNIVERTSKEWYYIDEVTKTPKPLPSGLDSTPSDSSKNYMALYRNPYTFQLEFKPNFGHQTLPVVCSRPSTEDECSKENVTHFFVNNLCHVAVSGQFTWFQAQNECHLRNLSMASFISINLNSTSISTQLNQSEYWIAITRSLWFWEDSGSYAHFSYWLWDMPSQNTSNNCAYFESQDNDNRWFRKSCNNDFAIMCMTDKNRPSAASSGEVNLGGLPSGSVAGITVGVIVIVALVTTVITSVVITKTRKTSA